MVYRPEIFSHIQTFVSFRGKPLLAIIFPSAGTSHEDYKSFLVGLKKRFDVIFVNKGFFGCMKKNTGEYLYTPDKLVERIVRKYNHIFRLYKRIFCIGQSYGSIHALKMHKTIPNAHLVLVSPPITYKTFHHERWGKPTLRMLVHTQTGRKILGLLNEERLKSICNQFPKTAIYEAQRPLRAAGVHSYLSCLYYIMVEGVITDTAIDEKITMIIGNRDPFLNQFCKQDVFKKRRETYVINADHHILQKKWEFVHRLLQQTIDSREH